jgi:hypothetical protein
MALDRLREKIVVVLPRTPLLENKKREVTGGENRPGLTSGVKSHSVQFKEISHQRTRSFEKCQRPLRAFFKAKIVRKEISECFSAVSVQDYQSKRALIRRPLHMNFRGFFSRDFNSHASNHSISSSSPKPNRIPNKEYIDSLSRQYHLS